jgi:hypothetical protein
MKARHGEKQMTVVPQIQSIGPPPALHADRVVAEMIHHIIAERDRRWAVYWDEWDHGSIGNPLGQSRMVERMRKAGGKLLLLLHLDPGKRARFELTVSEIAGYDPEINTIIHDKGPPAPAKPWLAVVCSHVKWHGRGRPSEIKGGAVLLLTHHALSRLAQRAAARTPADLIMAARVLFDVILHAGIEPDELPPAGRRLTISLPGHMGEATAVVARHDDPEVCALVVTTILEVGW